VAVASVVGPFEITDRNHAKLSRKGQVGKSELLIRLLGIEVEVRYVENRNIPTGKTTMDPACNTSKTPLRLHSKTAGI